MVEVIKDFTFISVTVVEVVEEDGKRRQHFVNARYANNHDDSGRLESIPWGEIMCRRITGLSMEDGRLVIGLSTKEPLTP